MEFGAVQQFREDAADVGLRDARAVVADGDAESVCLRSGRSGAVVARDDFDFDRDRRQDPGFLARIQCVVHRLLDRRQQCLARAVEAEQMAILEEELADGDLPVACRHLARTDRLHFTLARPLPAVRAGRSGVEEGSSARCSPFPCHCRCSSATVGRSIHCCRIASAFSSRKRAFHSGPPMLGCRTSSASMILRACSASPSSKHARASSYFAS